MFFWSQVSHLSLSYFNVESTFSLVVFSFYRKNKITIKVPQLSLQKSAYNLEIKGNCKAR